SPCTAPEAFSTGVNNFRKAERMDPTDSGSSTNTQASAPKKMMNAIRLPCFIPKAAGEESCSRGIPAACDFLQKLQLAQHFARAFRDGTQRIFGDVNGQAGFFRKQFVQPPQKRAAPRQNEASID